MSRRNAIKSFFHLARSRPPITATSPRKPKPPAAPMSSSASQPPTNGDPGDDTYNLSRFVRIQDARQNYAAALAEVRMGRKESHWMWFIFPQIAGLAKFPSDAARRYAISSLGEAEAYLAHPVLGHRLREISRAVLESEARDVRELMGGSAVDEDKLRSCMTLFKRVVDGLGERRDGDGVFEGVLGRYFGGVEDGKTVEKIRVGPRSWR